MMSYHSIAWLIKNKVIPETPLAVAKFLLSTDGLRKEQIGEYLGDHVYLHKHHTPSMNPLDTSRDDDAC